ncbi:cytochrome c oxidase assembly protein [Breoghania sp.]|uniref:cytochrome c oxidase assembly protein n=1 Tax=Breoghania sp. TaxID=2065378 RepID=UPI00262ADAF2|nr:cytochrome c oxidase assembly protein [Breoghania sp.]MDJ0931210.1 cytochrome c oxidase assembly protein [Breoghania sp.]
MHFDANVAGLDWDFVPEKHSIEIRIGEATKVCYTAHNRSDHPIVARATYNVTPYYAAPYFFKIECFCFTEEKLEPGETARMPLVFYVDEEIEKDESVRKTQEVTLSYTFFKSNDQSPANLASARALKAGSQKLDTQLTASGKADFSVDPKRVGSGSPVVR